MRKSELRQITDLFFRGLLRLHCMSAYFFAMQGAMMRGQTSSNLMPLSRGRWRLTKAEKLPASSLLLFSVHLSSRNLYQGNRYSLQNAITVSANNTSSCDHSYAADSDFLLCFAPFCRFSLAFNSFISAVSSSTCSSRLVTYIERSTTMRFFYWWTK